MEAEAVTRAADRRKRLAERIRVANIEALPGLVPATLRNIIEAEIKAPMRGGADEMKHTPLFGDSHKQLDLF